MVAIALIEGLREQSKYFIEVLKLDNIEARKTAIEWVLSDDNFKTPEFCLWALISQVKKGFAFKRYKVWKIY